MALYRRVGHEGPLAMLLAVYKAYTPTLVTVTLKHTSAAALRVNGERAWQLAMQQIHGDYHVGDTSTLRPGLSHVRLDAARPLLLDASLTGHRPNQTMCARMVRPRPTQLGVSEVRRRERYVPSLRVAPNDKVRFGAGAGALCLPPGPLNVPKGRHTRASRPLCLIGARDGGGPQVGRGPGAIAGPPRVAGASSGDLGQPLAPAFAGSVIGQ